VQGGVQRASEYEVGSVADLVTELEARGEETLLCGDGALRYASELGEIEHVDITGPAHAAPSLAALAELSIARYEREDFCSADDVLPLYLRKSDAELAWDRAAR
jgi:tRNA A37 threonylcarbamoyladenosine modification protein TsaB